MKNTITLLDPRGYAFQFDLTNVNFSINGTIKTTTIRDRGMDKEKRFPAFFETKRSEGGASTENEVQITDALTRFPILESLVPLIFQKILEEYMDDTMTIENEESTEGNVLRMVSKTTAK